MQCRAHVAQLGRLHNDFLAAGAQILVILGDTVERARQYAESLGAPFPVLSDPERALYHRYSLDKTMGVIQRTASIVVDRRGVIRYMRRTTNPMVWLQDIHELLNFVATLNQEQAAGR